MPILSAYFARNPEEGTVLRIPVHDDREVMMKVLQYGAMARVQKPASLCKKIKEEIALLSGRYR